MCLHKEIELVAHEKSLCCPAALFVHSSTFVNHGLNQQSRNGQMGMGRWAVSKWEPVSTQGILPCKKTLSRACDRPLFCPIASKVKFTTIITGLNYCARARECLRPSRERSPRARGGARARPLPPLPPRHRART